MEGRAEKKGEPRYTRRQFTLGLAAAAMTGGAMVGGGIELLKYEEERHRGAVTRQTESPKVFPDGTIYVPVTAQESFESFGGLRRLFAHTPPEFRMSTLPVRNLTSSGVVGELQRLEHAGILHRITPRDIQDNTEAYQNLNEIKEVGRKWRCRGIGMGNQQTPENDDNYLRLMPQAETILNQATSRFQEDLGHFGLSPQWRIRPIVTGLLRSFGPLGTNAIEGASGFSPHIFGMGIDLSLSRFDVIHVPNREFFMTSSASLDAELVGTLRRILAQALKKMHDEHKCVLTYEPGSGHFHLSDVKPRR